MSEGQRWGIVGGGLLGATLALRLAGEGRRVSLFEAAPTLGGLASAWQLGDVVWDRHYHVTLLSDAFTRGLLRDIGLEDEMRWVKTGTGLYGDGKLVPLSNAVDYLRMPTLGLLDKARLAATILGAARLQDWRSLEAQGVEEWLRRWSGNRVFDRLWAPLLRSKLGDAYPRSSAAFIWATIQRLYAARRSGLKEEMFGYVPGGYARVLERLEARLREAGVEVHLGAPARRVVPEGMGARVHFGDAEATKEEAFDRAVATLTPRQTARVVEGIAPDAAARMDALRYQGIVCASLLLDRPLADYYLTYLTDGDLPFTAIVEMTAFIDPAELGGRALVYLPRYADPSDPIFEKSDEALREEFLPALARVHPDFRPEHVLAFRVSRVREVFPFPVVDYSQKLAPRRLGEGLHWVSSAHIVNGTLNVNDTVHIAEEAAGALIESDGLRAEGGTAE